MILIVSFNARLIASLAKKIGLEIAIVDFWGDQDLFPLADKIFTVFKPEFKSYARFSNPRENEEKLAELALEVISQEDIEAVLIGSGLDDRPDLWERINAAALILGNTSKHLKEVRDVLVVHKRLKREEIEFPLTIKSNNISKIEDFVMKTSFPLVFKPIKTMGGVGSHLIQNKSELDEFCMKNSENLDEYYVQEYIQGKDISTTMVGDKNNFKMLSINEQLIGLESSGTKLRFKYCGNIVPFDCALNVAQKIEYLSIKIAKSFKLSGVFGIDFVLKDATPYFMEINPRFPGTIELLELVSQLNAVKLHLESMKGKIPEKIEKFQGYAMKQILFTKEKFLTSDLGQIQYLFDVPLPNLLLNPEDPICTIQLFDVDRNNLLQKINSLVNQIYLKVGQ